MTHSCCRNYYIFSKSKNSLKEAKGLHRHNRMHSPVSLLMKAGNARPWSNWTGFHWCRDSIPLYPQQGSRLGLLPTEPSKSQKSLSTAMLSCLLHHQPPPSMRGNNRSFCWALTHFFIKTTRSSHRKTLKHLLGHLGKRGAFQDLIGTQNFFALFGSNKIIALSYCWWL